VPSDLPTRTIRISRLTNNGDTPVNLLSAACDDPNLSVTTRTLEEGRRHEIRIELPPGFQPQPDGSEVLVKTDDAEHPEMRLAVQTIKPRQAIRRPRASTAHLIGSKTSAGTAKATDGRQVTIGGGSEEPQLLVFYTSWSGLSKLALPVYDRIFNAYREKGVEVIAINVDRQTGSRAREPEQIIGHYEAMNLSMPLVLDGQMNISRQYRLTHFPTAVLIGRSGEIEAVHVEARSGFERDVTRQLDLLLEGKDRSAFPASTSAARSDSTAAPKGRTRVASGQKDIEPAEPGSVPERSDDE
jgi:thiol-disulfide isomerase/thioredoxin